MLPLPAAPPAGTVVMIHGAGGGGWEYRFWTPVWKRARWTVVAPDLRPASAGLASTTFADYTLQVRRWARGARRPLVVVGASLGGALALSTAADLKPDALILVNAAGTEPSARKDEIPAIVRWANGPLKDTEDAMPDSDRATVLDAAPRWRDESGEVLRRLREGIAFGGWKAPALVILSEEDADVPPPASERLATRLSADTFRYARMSHVGPLLSRRAAEVAETARLWAERRVKEPPPPRLGTR